MGQGRTIERAQVEALVREALRRCGLEHGTHEARRMSWRFDQSVSVAWVPGNSASSTQCARSSGAAGATVLRGIEGYGRAARVHTAHILRLSEDLPILIEVVDREDRLRAILSQIDAMVDGGLITLEHVEVIAYRSPEPTEDS